MCCEESFFRQKRIVETRGKMACDYNLRGKKFVPKICENMEEGENVDNMNGFSFLE
jgi:hypothetical protein